MQTFIPYPDIHRSLMCLDMRRLGKQRSEAKQLIDTIMGRPMASGKPRTGWINHPAAVMWRGYLPALIYYYNTSLAVFAKRGGKNNKLQPEHYIQLDKLCSADMPWWWSDELVHRSHQSRLLFKGQLDVLSKRIKLFSGQRSVNNWLKTKFCPPINEFRHDDLDYVTLIMDNNNIPNFPNYYEQFDWNVSDDIEYYWPAETAGGGIHQVR